MPVQNQKHSIAGALHARTARRVWAKHHRKTSVMFVKLLEPLRRQYRRARHIVLIVDNFGIHKRRVAQRWLEENANFEPPFQPTYSP